MRGKELEEVLRKKSPLKDWNRPPSSSDYLDTLLSAGHRHNTHQPGYIPLPAAGGPTVNLLSIVPGILHS